MTQLIYEGLLRVPAAGHDRALRGEVNSKNDFTTLSCIKRFYGFQDMTYIYIYICIYTYIHVMVYIQCLNCMFLLHIILETTQRYLPYLH